MYQENKKMHTKCHYNALCGLSGILDDSQGHFGASSEGKCGEIAHISFFNRLAPLAGSGFRSEMDPSAHRFKFFVWPIGSIRMALWKDLFGALH
jgi:hypothetical protein